MELTLPAVGLLEKALLVFLISVTNGVFVSLMQIFPGPVPSIHSTHAKLPETNLFMFISYMQSFLGPRKQTAGMELDGMLETRRERAKSSARS